MRDPINIDDDKFGLRLFLELQDNVKRVQIARMRLYASDEEAKLNQSYMEWCHSVQNGAATLFALRAPNDEACGIEVYSPVIDTLRDTVTLTNIDVTDNGVTLNPINQETDDPRGTVFLVTGVNMRAQDRDCTQLTALESWLNTYRLKHGVAPLRFQNFDVDTTGKAIHLPDEPGAPLRCALALLNAYEQLHALADKNKPQK